MNDAELMARAVRLAARGLGATYPNPSVGAIVVKNGEIVGSGRSAPTGGPHAEVLALRRAGAAARGSTLYVTLEPCCHEGRTGPCTRAIIEAGVRRVVVGITDPAPHASGRGFRILRRAGIEMVRGVEARACAAVHEHYLHHARHGIPFVTLKAACSLDGRIAMPGGHSKWITGARARAEGHRLRALHHAVAVGVNTVLLDDPRLDVRAVRGVDPIPVVFDTRLRSARARPTPAVLRSGALVLHTNLASASARRRIAKTGAEPVEIAADRHGRVSITAALRVLGRREIRSLLVEGGGGLLGAFVEQAAWQRFCLFHAPRLLGEGRPVLAGVSWPRVDAAPRVEVEAHRRVGEDFLTVVRPRR